MEWIASISTLAVYTFIIYLLRKLIITRLTNSVKHEYDKKIEHIKTDLRISEEKFKSELKAKETEINVLRNGALTGIVNRQAVLFEREIIAVEKLWESVVSLSSAKFTTKLISLLKFEAVAAEAAKNPKLRESFSKIDKVNLEELNSKDATSARPFLSPLTWALYNAYRSIILHAVMKLQILKLGLNVDILEVDEILKLVKAALPEREEYIDEHGLDALHNLLDEIEEKLLIEIKSSLSGEKHNQESIDMSAKILKEAEKIMEHNEEVSNIYKTDAEKSSA